MPPESQQAFEGHILLQSNKSQDDTQQYKSHIEKQKILHQNAGFVVEHTGFEPVTSTMRIPLERS